MIIFHHAAVHRPEASPGFTKQLTSKYNYIFSTLNTYFHLPASFSIVLQFTFKSAFCPPLKAPSNVLSATFESRFKTSQNPKQNPSKTTYRTRPKSSRQSRMEQPSIAQTEESPPAQTGTTIDNTDRNTVFTLTVGRQGKHRPKNQPPDFQPYTQFSPFYPDT